MTQSPDENTDVWLALRARYEAEREEGRPLSQLYICADCWSGRNQDIGGHGCSSEACQCPC
jgi:hypothetical protein